MEDDERYIHDFVIGQDFNPRPPCGGRRIGQRHSTIIKNFNPRPPCGGRPGRRSQTPTAESISIHVPRVEDDDELDTDGNIIGGFQSTSPVWRTTKARQISPLNWRHFNPRPPCGGRLAEQFAKIVRDSISIHVPRVEDDPQICGQNNRYRNFNPRPPCGGRHEPVLAILAVLCKISIHVPRVEDDMSRFSQSLRYCAKFQSTSPVWRTTWKHRASGVKRYDFNPRPPCGGRLHSRAKANLSYKFQSTSPVWRTTNHSVKFLVD